MAIYYILRAPGAEGGDPADIKSLFIREGFSFFAFALPPVWALRHRLWLAFLYFLVVILALIAAIDYIGQAAGFALYGLYAAYMGFEAASIRLKTLARRGYDQGAPVIAPDLEQARLLGFKRGARA